MALSSSHRSGKNAFASAPQIAVERLIQAMGMQIWIPLVTVILSTKSPDLVYTGFEMGRTSSSIACKKE